MRRTRGDRGSPRPRDKMDKLQPPHSSTLTEKVAPKRKVLTTGRIASRMKTKKIEAEEFEFPSENENDSCLLDDTQNSFLAELAEDDIRTIITPEKDQ